MTLLRCHKTLLRFDWLLFFARIMESDSKFEQSYGSDDLEYNFISGYEIEVEETTISEQRAASPRNLDPHVFEVYKD